MCVVAQGGEEKFAQVFHLPLRDLVDEPLAPCPAAQARGSYWSWSRFHR